MHNSDKMFVKPAAGRQVRDPKTREPLPAEGKAVARSSYWLRRLRDGDVVAAAPASAPSKPTLKKV